MTFFPAGFDPRADMVGVLYLVNINTPDGDFGFMLGQDGRFTDTTSKVWQGAVLVSTSETTVPINGVAPEGTLSMQMFDEDGSVAAEIMALGSDYILGRALSFYVQPLLADSDLWAPQVPPILRGRYVMRSVRVGQTGPMQFALSLSYEGAFEGRNTARGWYYTNRDHGRLVGGVNNSLIFAPTNNRQPEKMF